MKDKYSVNVFWDEEDKCFIATCPEFPLLSAHGDTREEATSEFQIVLEMAIESYTEDELELPKPRTVANYSGQFRIRMRKSLHKELAETALKEGVSLNAYTVSVIAENHSIKKAYREKTDTLERIIDKIAINMVAQHQRVQIHTQKLDFIETSTRRQKTPENEWSSIQFSPAIYTDTFLSSKS